MYEEAGLHFYYSLADRLNKSVHEIMQFTEAELDGWVVYFERISSGK